MSAKVRPQRGILSLLLPHTCPQQQQQPRAKPSTAAASPLKDTGVAPWSPSYVSVLQRLLSITYANNTRSCCRNTSKILLRDSRVIGALRGGHGLEVGFFQLRESRYQARKMIAETELALKPPSALWCSEDVNCSDKKGGW